MSKPDSAAAANEGLREAQERARFLELAWTVTSEDQLQAMLERWRVPQKRREAVATLIRLNSQIPKNTQDQAEDVPSTPEPIDE